MFEILLFLGFLTFWGILTYLTEGDENPTFALLMIALGAGVTAYFQGVTWSDVAAALPLIVYGALAYLVIGVLWSVARWTFYVRRLSERYRQLRADFLASRPGVNLETDAKARAMLKDEAMFRLGVGQLPPSVMRFKSKLYAWLVLWPFSATWTLTHEPARIVFSWAYRAAQATYRRIAEFYFRDFSKDFE